MADRCANALRDLSCQHETGGLKHWRGGGKWIDSRDISDMLRRQISGRASEPLMLTRKPDMDRGSRAGGHINVAMHKYVHVDHLAEEARHAVEDTSQVPAQRGRAIHPPSLNTDQMNQSAAGETRNS